MKIGAPYVDRHIWMQAIHSIEPTFEGVSLEPTFFTPAFQKYAGKRCEGLQIGIHDRDTFQPYRLGIRHARSRGQSLSA